MHSLSLSFFRSLFPPLSRQTLDLINFISLTEFGHIQSVYKPRTEHFISADYFNLMSPPAQERMKICTPTVNLYAYNYINRWPVPAEFGRVKF